MAVVSLAALNDRPDESGVNDHLETSREPKPSPEVTVQKSEDILLIIRS